MIRDNVKRLSRRTWCTTKKKERLAYAVGPLCVLPQPHLAKALNLNHQHGKGPV